MCLTEWQASTAVLMDKELTNNLWGTFNLNWFWRDDHNTGSDLAPIKEQDAYSLVNGSIGVHTGDGRWEAQLWAQNLLDESYDTVIFNSVLHRDGGSVSKSRFVGPPRMYGLTLRTNF
jgi:iron complex outermembrane receptor protein